MGIFMGMGIPWVFGRNACGYSKRFTQKLGGCSCFVFWGRYWCIFLIFWTSCSNTFSKTLGYVGILWNTLEEYFAEYLYKNVIPKDIIIIWILFEYPLNTTMEYPWNTTFEYPGTRGIPRIPLNTSQNSSNTIEYYIKYFHKIWE